MVVPAVVAVANVVVVAVVVVVVVVAVVVGGGLVPNNFWYWTPRNCKVQCLLRLGNQARPTLFEESMAARGCFR